MTRAAFLGCTVAALGALAIPAIPSALGYRVMVVISGSMEPKIHVGDAVLVRPAVPTNIAVGDTITFQPFGTMELKTHRVIAIERREGHLYFQTKGDANATPDPDFADSDTVLGTVSLRLPGAGRGVPGALETTGPRHPGRGSGAARGRAGAPSAPRRPPRLAPREVGDRLVHRDPALGRFLLGLPVADAVRVSAILNRDARVLP